MSSTLNKICFMLVILFTYACSSSSIREYTQGEGLYNGSYEIKKSAYSLKIDISLESDILMNVEETEVISYPNSSSLSLDLKDKDGHITIKYESDSQGNVDSRYKLNGKQVEQSDISSIRLQTVWQAFFRITGVSVDHRLQNIIGSRGVNGVLGEIDSIESNSVKRRYIEALVKQYDVNDQEMLRLIDETREINSNSSKKEALFAIFMAKRELSLKEFSSLMKAARTITSNSNLGELLSELLNTERFTILPFEADLQLLSSAKEISSSSTLGDFLQSFVLAEDNNDLLIEAMTIASKHIASSSVQERFYLNLLDRTHENFVLEQIIALSSQSIASSSSLYSVLEKTMENEGFSRDLAQSMRLAIQRVGSSSSREALLNKLIEID